MMEDMSKRHKKIMTYDNRVKNALGARVVGMTHPITSRAVRILSDPCMEALSKCNSLGTRRRAFIITKHAKRTVFSEDKIPRIMH